MEIRGYPRIPSVFKPAGQQISDNLTEMHHLFASHSLFDLFVKSVKERNAKKVKQLVSEVAKDLKELGPVELQDPSTHNRRQHQVEILQAGLEKLLGEARSPAEETAAIDQDDQRFQRPLSRISSPQESQLVPIVVYDMRQPERSFTLPILSKCKYVRLYLQTEGLATRPELWARHQDKQRQSLTPNGLYWEWLKADAPIQDKHLEFVNRDRLCDYIVVLKHVTRPVPREVPEAIDLPSNGVPCCSLECKYLSAHLAAIWPQQRVLQARKIDGQKVHDVLCHKFDDLLFDPRTNNLIVDVELKECNSV